MSIFWHRRRPRGGLKDKPISFLGDEVAKKFFHQGIKSEQFKQFQSAIKRYRQAKQAAASDLLVEKISRRIMFCEKAIWRGECVESM